MTSGTNDTKSVKLKMGERLKAARKQKQYSRTKLTEQLNGQPERPIVGDKLDSMSVERLKKWEYGNNPISHEWIPLLCKVLNCDVGYLYGDYDERTRDIADVCQVTGLTESAVKVLCVAKVGFYNRTVDFYDGTINSIDIINGILESSNLPRLLDNLVYYLNYGGAVRLSIPDEDIADIEALVTKNKEQRGNLTKEEHKLLDQLQRFRKWISARGGAVGKARDLRDMRLQEACETFRSIAKEILKDSGGDPNG